MINKYQLIDLYTKDRLTTKKIAEIYGVNRTTVSNWLKKHNIPIRNKQLQYEQNAQIQLSQDQKDLIVGSILGDGHIAKLKSGRLARFSETHSISQVDYLQWKCNILGDICSGIKHRQIYNKSYRKHYKICLIYTKGTVELLKYHSLFYNNGVKLIRGPLILSPLSLAVWYMDDGLLHHGASALCTDSFNYEDHVNLQKIIYDNFNLYAKITPYNQHYYRLQLSAKETNNMHSIILPHIPDTMLYKIKSL